MSLERVSPETPSAEEELLEKLRDLVPDAFLDGAIDAGALLEALGLAPAEKPGFTFRWPGIESARDEARSVTTTTLVPDRDGSVSWDDSKDVLIEGNNLQVLKLLKSGYSGAAKLIYIDPPYNTGDSFTYNDDFAIPESEYLTASGQVDDQGNALTSAMEVRGRKHAPWLSMMFSRLTAARHLLQRDGVILASIDNNEVHHLRLLLDATFGAANFVDMMTWQGGRKGDAKFTAGGQDYILVYARDLAHLKQIGTTWRQRKVGLEEVYAKESELLSAYGDDLQRAQKELRDWFADLPEGNPAKYHSHYNHIDSGGVWTSDNSSSPNLRANLLFTFKGFEPPENGWRYDEQAMERLDAEGKLIYPSGKATRIRIKKYLHDQEYWAPPSSFQRDRSGASSALENLMGAKVFDDPKSVDVLAKLIESITSEGDLIVDFFAGSGSTGHAVWKQSSVDGVDRQWLLVQAPEKPDESEDSGKNAVSEGYASIFEITAERLRRAASELVSEAPLLAPAGFRIFRSRPTNLVVDPPITATESMSGETYVQAAISAAQGEPVVAGSDPLAVAWEIALKATATRLDASVTEHLLDGVTVYEFLRRKDQAGGRLFISLDAFDLDTAEALKLSDEDTLVVRGDQVSDATTATLAPRLRAKLLMLERAPREVSL